MTFTQEFIDQSLLRFNENPPRVETCVKILTEDEVWFKPNSVTNSIGNLILHLCGNITQYITSSLGGREDIRDREMEFTISNTHSKIELLTMLGDVTNEASAIIKNMSEQELLKPRSVQGFTMTGIAIIIHVVEHFSYHTGQIAYLTKALRDRDLGFYTGLDLNKKNENL